jgi:FdhE protein
MAPQAVAADQWTARRQRAVELAERWPFAAEVLGFYAVLLDAQAAAYEAAQGQLPLVGSDPGGSPASAPDLARTAAYIVERSLPRVREVTLARGTGALRQAVAEDRPADDWDARVRGWLAGEALPAIDLFLVRAAAGPVLEALGPAAGGVCAGPRDERHCPHCGGRPQVSVFVPSGEDLVAPRRYLECSRCAARWPFGRMVCAGCGEQDTKQLPIFAEEGTGEVEATGSVVRGTGNAPGAPVRAGGARFPHLSIHACRTCAQYLLNVDLTRDGRAVPVVDELSAIPLDLYAREQGLTKVVPNLMGL